jgi:hypothetical protein
MRWGARLAAQERGGNAAKTRVLARKKRYRTLQFSPLGLETRAAAD